MKTYMNSRQPILESLKYQFRMRNPRGKGIKYEDAIQSLAYVMVELMREQCETPLDRTITADKIKEIWEVIL